MPTMYWADLSELTASVDARTDGAFIDTGCRARIGTIARCVPAKAAESLLFERRLGQGDARVDFAFALNAFGAQWLVGSDVWPEIRTLVDGASAQIPGMPLPWLEFDTSRSNGEASVPSVYVPMDARSANRAAMLALAKRLNGCPTTSMPTVERCVAAFPRSVRILYVGAMRSRNVYGIRLSMSPFAFPALLRYLRAVEWPGDLAHVESVLTPFASACTRFGVQLDVGADLKRWLGVELMIDSPQAGETSGSGARDVLQLFQREGRCSAYESAQLAKWPSNTAVVASLLDRLMDVRYPRPRARIRHGSLVTAINHFKLTFWQDGSIATKAYLSVRLDPLED